ncbi:conserved protein of unknown function [Streptomyces murinus]|uniref:hypothetical protein n=1 Tax=Streptomyces murinus TaxID=33900 RepID=UPI003D66A4ED
MPADEVSRGSDADESRGRTGARHAAPRKPLFTRFHMPAGKAIATVAMPTAVLMGMGFTSTLALAAGNGGGPASSPAAKSLTADEYKDCVKALDDSKDPSSSPSPSATKSTEAPTPTSSPSGDATKDTGKDSAKDTSDSSSKDSGSGSDSGSDTGSAGRTAPKPTETSGTGSGAGAGSGSGTTTPSASASQGGGGLLGTIGDTLGNILTGGKQDTATPSASATPSVSPSPSASGSTASSSGTKLSDTVKDTTSKAAKTVGDTVKNTTGTVSKTVDDAGKAVEGAGKAVKDTADSATPSPTTSASPSAEDCPAATTDEGGVDNPVPVANDPWYLQASSLLLKGADYQGIVEVRTAGGTTKKVLKYVISDGTDIGDLHQTVHDSLSGKTYHVQASKGSTSTIRDGKTVMYTESISGNLFGLIPMTFTPDSPPPLNLPLIYFTNVKVTQAAQFGGSLHVPGMHVYTTG